MADLRENVIEWITGQETIYVTLTQQRFITKVKKLAVKYPNLVIIEGENEDGSIYARLPLKALKLNIITKEELSEEDKRKGADRLKKWREENKGESYESNL